jgi:type VI secretion system secreted protein VgrG
MFLAKVLPKALRLLAACTLALFALGANARAMDDLQAQNTLLEKIEPLPLDAPRAWLAQAVDSPEENTCFYDDGVSGPTHYNYFRSYQASQGRYSQSDPIGLGGGLNRFGYVNQNPLSDIDPEGLNPALACYRAGRVGWEIGQRINPYVQPILASAIDSMLLSSSANASGAAAQRQAEYRNAKDFCDTPPPPGGNDCSTLSRQIDHAEETIRRYEAWDAKWLPGRHAEKLGTWKKRLQNLKDEHNQKCTQCR